MNEERESLYDDITTYVTNKKLILSQLLQSNNELLLKSSKVNFNCFDKITVTIKNIKTREEYECPHKIMNDTLKINLLPLIYLFTDYEGSLNINLTKANTTFLYTPVVSKNNFIQTKDSKKSSQLLKWYLRLVDNGEIRLSSIITSKN